MRNPKVVVIGGGTGIPVILSSLREKGCDITAIVTVADDGGSSGDIRKSLTMAPPGDVRNVLSALSNIPQIYEDIFQYRFKKSGSHFDKHSLGNIIIAGVSEMVGSNYDGIQILAELMHCDGDVFPASEEPLTLHAVFEDGSMVTGESHIADVGKMIDHVYVTNTYNDEQPTPAPLVIKAILEADMIVLGPGSLFTSILPNLVIKEIGEALRQTKAEVVYICNIMTQRGETEHFTDAEHVRVLHRHLDMKFIDTVLVNNEKVPDGYMDPEIYDEYLVQVVHDFDGIRQEGCRVISNNFLKLRDKGVFHDGDLVVEDLLAILYGERKIK